MSHPDDAHGLRVQLTAALLDCHALRARITAAESQRDALRAENERLREVVQAGIGVHGDPCSKGEECQFMRDARAALAGGGDRG